VFAASPHRRAALMLGGDDPYWHTDLDFVARLEPDAAEARGRTGWSSCGVGCAGGESLERVWNSLLVHSVRELRSARKQRCRELSANTPLR
jgi:hypothetical protein